MPIEKGASRTLGLARNSPGSCTESVEQCCPHVDGRVRYLQLMYPPSLSLRHTLTGSFLKQRIEVVEATDGEMKELEHLDNRLGNINRWSCQPSLLYYIRVDSGK